MLSAVVCCVTNMEVCLTVYLLLCAVRLHTVEENLTAHEYATHPYGTIRFLMPDLKC